MSIQQERELVWSMLTANLPEAYREPMILFYRCEESTRDVAIALGESEATIRQQLKRGRDMLRAEMTESIRTTLGVTVPKAAFAAIVMASLPSTTYATAQPPRLQRLRSQVSRRCYVGHRWRRLFSRFDWNRGRRFGTWISWKNCEYERQQRFIVRQALLFSAGLVIFLVLLEILVALRVQGARNPNDTVYGSLLVGLILGSQGFACIWIWRDIRRFKQI